MISFAIYTTLDILNKLDINTHDRAATVKIMKLDLVASIN